jgi:hypothetical protein
VVLDDGGVWWGDSPSTGSTLSGQYFFSKSMLVADARTVKINAPPVIPAMHGALHDDV